MKNITSRADVFPFPRSFLDHLNRRTKIKLRCRCFVNFFCGDAVFVIFFLRCCGVDSPPMSPSLRVCSLESLTLKDIDVVLKEEQFSIQFTVQLRHVA